MPGLRQSGSHPLVRRPVSSATEERRLAMGSADPKARRIHLEMTAKYALLAGANPNLINEGSPETGRRTWSLTGSRQPT